MGCWTDLADVRTVDKQLGVRKLYLTLGKCPHFPLGCGGDENAIKHTPRESKEMGTDSSSPNSQAP